MQLWLHQPTRACGFSWQPRDSLGPLLDIADQVQSFLAFIGVSGCRLVPGIWEWEVSPCTEAIQGSGAFCALLQSSFPPSSTHREDSGLGAARGTLWSFKEGEISGSTESCAFCKGAADIQHWVRGSC